MISVRLATYYASSFMMLGVHLIFWPIWLTERGLSATDIGTVLALGIASKLIANPLVAHFSDQLGQRKILIVLLTSLSFLAFLFYKYTQFFLGKFILLENHDCRSSCCTLAPPVQVPLLGRQYRNGGSI